MNKMFESASSASEAISLSNLRITKNLYSFGQASGRSLNGIFSTFKDTNGTVNLESLVDYVCDLFPRYKKWWFRLYSEDPFHVIIESLLTAFLIYMIVGRRQSTWRDKMKEKLSEEETEELLTEWKEHSRVPLAPTKSSLGEKPMGTGIIVEKVCGSKLTIRKANDKKSRTVLNFATHDFLGVSCPDLTNPANAGAKDVVKDASREALNIYGCGSCGPRGFYGTIDAHLNLEDAMARFTNTEGAILYSDGAAAVSSTVAAFAKRGDLLVVDDGVYEPLSTGVTLSRANVRYFKHNDMEDLRRVLERIRATDATLKRKSNDQRRFIVVEGLYKNHGTICPLDELIKLKQEFCYRLILDESFSFGSLGKTGRGALEHYNLKHMRDAEIVTISMENAMGSVGGVTVGNEEVVDHQRLSGAGYCFSASNPPFLAMAALASLNKMEMEPQLLDTLRQNVKYFYDSVDKTMSSIIPSKLIVTSVQGVSPIVLFKLSNDKDNNLTREEKVDLLDQVAEFCLNNGIALVSTGRHIHHHLHKVPSPALRLTITSKHSKNDIDDALRVLEKAVETIIV